MKCSAIMSFVGFPSGTETRLWARRAVTRIVEKELDTDTELGEKDGSSLVRIIGTYYGMKGLDEL